MSNLDPIQEDELLKVIREDGGDTKRAQQMLEDSGMSRASAQARCDVLWYYTLDD